MHSAPDPDARPGADGRGSPGQGRRRRGPAEGEGWPPGPSGSGGPGRGGSGSGSWEPGARGGHPEQHEPGGGWGAPASGGPRIPRPRAAEPEAGPRPGVAGATGFGPAGGPRFGARVPDGPPKDRTPDGFGGPAIGGLATPLAPQGAPGPRREYVEAFADDDVFSAGAPGAGEARDGVPPGGRFTGRSVVFDRESDQDAEFDDPDPRAALGADGMDQDGGEEPAPLHGAEAMRAAKKGAKGRTFTGAAAAAVTTVLAVVIAGQVADQHKNDDVQPRSGPDRADGLDDASPTQTPPKPDAKPASYAQKMAQVFPLDPKLTADGTFTPAGGDAKAPGRGQVLRYRVDIEDGMPLDGELFAQAVHKTLNDERSWAHGGQRAFQRVGSGDADFVITLASPGTTAKWCAKSGLDTTEDNVSCDSAATDRVMINAYRWAQGAKTYGQDEMFAYRQMLINHEIGHRLGHNHEGCGRQGALAPVMMQQTKFLTTDGATCRPNSWPFPTQR
ncbi:DUF3152 domain-containing protein [Streptomyces sp. NPDC048248]|uniref:DUF3152 domain-containing protein n=1 Tax=Streptomyces sp. NPDC048248 TaxID=3365523 RepID=UPI00371E464F